MLEPSMVSATGAVADGVIAPRATVASVRLELDAVWAEVAAVRESIGDREPTGHEWDALSARIERLGAQCKQTARWARVIAMNAHKAQR